MRLTQITRGGGRRIAIGAGVAASVLTISILPAGGSAEVGGEGQARGGGGAGACPTQPTYSESVTSPAEAIPGYPDVEATTAQINAYVEQLDAESDRVSAAEWGESVDGTRLLYAFAGDPADVADPGAVAAQQQRLRLRAAATSKDEASRIARRSPAIAWYAGNVHGDEPSGGDAAIQLLYEVAAREDCAAEQVRDELLTGVIPTQNPDGRDADTRANRNGFDLNRDWFARTQPETDQKVALLREFPPVVFVDAHEMGGAEYFFPPNADPIHHEISPQSVRWINDLYGRANQRAFEAREEPDNNDFDYFNYDIYDLLYMGYGDTVPTTAFTSAGMTYEKGGSDDNRQRWLEQRVAGWTTLKTAARNKASILTGYWRAHRRALAEGRAGELEPNQVLQPGNEVRNRVPDMKVRNYFFSPSNFPESSELVERLREVDVKVFRLEAPLRVRGLQRYGRRVDAARLPAGTYWVPMSQVQKRWVQAILGEDSYVPFPYFYDVTAWSNPLLMNLDAWFTGRDVDPQAARVRSAPEGSFEGPDTDVDYATMEGRSPREVAAALALEREGLEVERLAGDADGLDRGDFVIDLNGGDGAGIGEIAERYRVVITPRSGPIPDSGDAIDSPRIAILASNGESASQMRFTLGETWGLPFDQLTATEVTAGELETGDYDVFIVPGVNPGAMSAGAVITFIENGGTYVGTARPGGVGGTPYAVSRGLTTAELSRPEDLVVPGTMFRARTDRDSPLTLGAPEFTYPFHIGEDVLSTTDTGENAITYPQGGADFFTSGYAEGEEALEGTAALIEERRGDGRVVLFAGEPNYRAYTDAMALHLANAIAYPETDASAGADTAAPRLAPDLSSAATSAPEPIGPGRPIRIEVPAAEAGTASAVLESLGASGLTSETAGGSAYLTIPNPQGLDADFHPFAREIVPALEGSGVTVLAAIL